MYTIPELNRLDPKKLKNELFQCCGTSSYTERLAELRPYRDLDDLLEKSNYIWYNLNNDSWLEAFAHHPRIGDLSVLREKFNKHQTWSASEQSQVEDTSEQILQELKEKNDEYFDKNQFIFIVFASGKSAEEMLEILNHRLRNTRDKEIKIASREQNKITRTRLTKLVK